MLTSDTTFVRRALPPSGNAFQWVLLCSEAMTCSRCLLQEALDVGDVVLYGLSLIQPLITPEALGYPALAREYFAFLSWLIETGETPRLLGLLAFGDQLKEGAAQAIAKLREQSIGSHLISGDNPGSVAAVAGQTVGSRICRRSALGGLGSATRRARFARAQEPKRARIGFLLYHGLERA